MKPTKLVAIAAAVMAVTAGSVLTACGGSSSDSSASPSQASAHQAVTAWYAGKGGKALKVFQHDLSADTPNITNGLGRTSRESQELAMVDATFLRGEAKDAGRLPPPVGTALYRTAMTQYAGAFNALTISGTYRSPSAISRSVHEIVTANGNFYQANAALRAASDDG